MFTGRRNEMVDFNAEIKSLSFDDIATDVDYEGLGLLQNHLMHEVKRMNPKEFVEKYTSSLGDLANNVYEYNLGVGILKKISGGSCSLEPRPLEKYVIDPRIAGDYIDEYDELTEEDKTEILQDMNDAISDFIPEFKMCGILYTSFDEAM